uniref:Uncharacterized protein n=1 Tax=Oncorhynchus tshawytscha TaxID=74940 RepID=A0AAZ3Q0U0_ONCTS
MKLKLGRKWVFQLNNDPTHTSKVVAKWLENKVKVLEWQSQSPDLDPREFVIRTELACASKGAYNPDCYTSSQEQWAKIHPTYCGKLVEGYPKRLTQVKPF